MDSLQGYGMVAALGAACGVITAAAIYDVVCFGDRLSVPRDRPGIRRRCAMVSVPVVGLCALIAWVGTLFGPEVRVALLFYAGSLAAMAGVSFCFVLMHVFVTMIDFRAGKARQ